MWCKDLICGARTPHVVQDKGPQFNLVVRFGPGHDVKGSWSFKRVMEFHTHGVSDPHYMLLKENILYQLFVCNSQICLRK